MSTSRVIAFAALLLAAATLAAQPPVTSTGDPLDDCRTCHRPRAPGSGEVPVIEGQHADYLELQLHYFLQRHRESFPMDAVAAEYGASRASELAAAAAALPWGGTRPKPASAAASRGAKRAEELGCANCHGPDYVGAGVIPRLAGQGVGYLTRSIVEIALDEREHPEMPGRERPLEEADAATIAAYLATLAPKSPATPVPAR